MKLQQRLTSFLLCLVIMITGLVGYIPGTATDALLNENQSIADAQGKSETLADSTIVDSNIAANETAAVGSEKIQLPDIVKGDISSSQFIGRAKEKETNLNTFVFKNQDGTQTMKVYSHPVKYIDEKGKVQDISTDIKLNANGTFETKANSIKTVFSKELKDGITLQANNVNIRLVSDKIADGKLSDDKKIVTYKYDDKTDIEYSLTYTGFKEDIVVNEYTGQTEYEFTLYTNGLTLVKENGSYFLKDSKGKVQATIGDIIIFTADDRNNAFGDMAHETITPNQEYVMIIHVDKDYLEDEKTKYPIRIDPTIEINYDDSGAGAIEDVTISQGTTYGGTSGSLYIGRNTDGTLSRALMRFPNLNLIGISASQIISADIELKDLMCQDDEPMIIECRPYLNTAPSWSEAQTVTWTSVSTNYYGAVLDSHEVLYGQGNAVDSGSKHRYSFDLTALAREWVNGTQSAEKGIVLKATDSFEGQTGSNVQYWKKTFASYNRAADKPTFNLNYFSIESTGGELIVTEGDTLSLSVSAPLGCDITWISSNQNVATVDNGIVSGIKAGTTIITAKITYDGDIISDSCLVYVTIEDGVYFLQNKQSTYFADIKNKVMANGTIIHQWQFHGGNTQRWIFTYVGEGYYTIHSKNSTSTYYLGIENDSMVVNDDVVLRTGQITDGMKWKISVTNSGAYRLTPKNGEADDYALASSSSSATNGARLMQGEFWYNNSYCDEWNIYRQEIYTLMYIGYANGDPLMPPIVSSVETALQTNANMYGYGYTSLSKNDLLTRLTSTSIFSCITHGYTDSIVTTDGTLSISDINSLGTAAFDDLIFVYFGACLTGSGGTGATNLVNAVYNKGADVVLGFKISVFVAETNLWTQIFMETLSTGVTIDAAMQEADKEVREDADLTVLPFYSTVEEYRHLMGSAQIAPCN